MGCQIPSGNIVSRRVSPVREYVFQGNQDAYEAFQMVSATASAGLFSAASASPGVCFVAGTPISTENGLVPIEQIVAGQLVWAEDPETGEKALKRVIRTFINENDELIHIGINGESISCTTEHPFYVISRGWVAAKRLRIGDKIEQQTGSGVYVESIVYEKLEKPILAYNFEVEKYHTYFVGLNAMLVHNKCGDPGHYEIEYSDGKKYIGKGSVGRMNVSIRMHAAPGRELVSATWVISDNNKMAFVDEYLAMREAEFPDNPNLLNKIQSPGLLYWLQMGGH